MKILRNIAVPFKMYEPARYMIAQKPAIRRARAEGDFAAESAALCRATSGWGDAVVRHFHMDVTVSGQENIPRQGPVVVISDHQGYSDIPVLLHVIRDLPLSFVAKKGMGALPFYGHWMKKWECCVMMDQANLRASIESLHQGMRLLQAGYSMVVFPEGHRSKGPVPGPFKKGSFRLATELGVPILPVSIDGTYNVYEAQGYTRPASIHVTIHPPVQTAGLDRAGCEALFEQVRDTITGALGKQGAQKQGD